MTDKPKYLVLPHTAASDWTEDFNEAERIALEQTRKFGAELTDGFTILSIRIVGTYEPCSPIWVPYKDDPTAP